MDIHVHGGADVPTFVCSQLSNRGRFPYFHSLIQTRGEVGRIRDSYANRAETQSRVCITVKNSPNSPEWGGIYILNLNEALETRKRVRCCFDKVFLKDKSTNKGKWWFFCFLIEQIFLTHAHISYQPINMRVWQYIPITIRVMSQPCFRTLI